MPSVPELTPLFWEKANLNKKKYNTFVETGSYRGYAIDYFKDKFKTIHSIEITEKWYDFCVEKFKNDPHVKLHLGDSAVKLPEVLENIKEPVIVFLDAHYSGGTTGKPTYTTDDSSVLEELNFLKTRKYDDILIIDDISFFSAKGGEESKEPNNDNIDWHPFKYDWSNITKDKVLSLIKPNYSWVENKNSLYTMTPREDQLIFFPKKFSKGFSHKYNKNNFIKS